MYELLTYQVHAGSGHTHVSDSATDCGRYAIQVALGEAKIRELDDRAVLVAPQENIFQLDVSVGHTHSVAVVQR